MPTTLIGLVLFVVLLLPGFAYLVGKERAGTERRTSPFRETVAVVAASVSAELVVGSLLSVVWLWFLDDIVDSPGRFWKNNPHFVLAFVLVWVVASTTLAWAATIPRFREFNWVPRWVRKLVPQALKDTLVHEVRNYPHPSTVSAWWLLFDEYRGANTVHVGVMLEDSSYIHGKLGSFNNNADDTEDRELVLLAPITYRPPSGRKVHDLKCGAACVSARRITALTAAYVDESSSSAVGGGG